MQRHEFPLLWLMQLSEDPLCVRLLSAWTVNQRERWWCTVEKTQQDDRLLLWTHRPRSSWCTGSAAAVSNTITDCSPRADRRQLGSESTRREHLHLGWNIKAEHDRAAAVTPATTYSSSLTALQLCSDSNYISVQDQRRSVCHWMEMQHKSSHALKKNKQINIPLTLLPVVGLSPWFILKQQQLSQRTVSMYMYVTPHLVHPN